nr:uncharacterized protein LOC127335357 [Lolium perenne]
MLAFAPPQPRAPVQAAAAAASSRPMPPQPRTPAMVAAGSRPPRAPAAAPCALVAAPGFSPSSAAVSTRPRCRCGKGLPAADPLGVSCDVVDLLRSGQHQSPAPFSAHHGTKHRGFHRMLLRHRLIQLPGTIPGQRAGPARHWPGPSFTCLARHGTQVARELAGRAVPAHVPRPPAPAWHIT